MKKGVTFSHRALQSYGQNVDLAYEELLSWNLDVLRLCVYWDESEPKRDVFDFSSILLLLKQAEKRDQKVILVIGAKSPRWPEFYWPSWLNESEKEERILRFLDRCIEIFSPFSNILYWQVENEPLDPSGPQNEVIPLALLQSEVKFIRELSEVPIVLTAWGNDEKKRKSVSQLLPLADAVGLDWYPKQFVGRAFSVSLYKGPDRTENALRTWLASIRQPVWFTELQAEPWEKDEASFWCVWPESMNPEILRQNISFAESLPLEGVLAWGYEYWWSQKQKGNDQLFSFMKERWSKPRSSTKIK